ncbi:MAG: ydcV 2 [Marmoricola sp.]|nr:ydcV 2 [Marmoricola sp.]
MDTNTRAHLGIAGRLAGRLVIALYLVGVLALMFAPLVVLAVFSVNSGDSVSLPFTGFSLHWFHELFHNTEAVDAIKNSVVVAAIVTPASVFLGLTSAYGTARLTGRARAVSLGLISIPLVVPWLVTGVAGLLFFNSINVQGSLVTVVLMQIVVTFPLVTLVLYARLVGMDPSVEEAGLDLGSTGVGVLFRLVIPQLLTPMLVGALFAFISSLGNFVITFFVTGYSSTLPIWGYSALKHAENLPVVNAASTVMLGLNLVLFLGVLLIARRDRESVDAWL